MGYISIIILFDSIPAYSKKQLILLTSLSSLKHLPSYQTGSVRRVLAINNTKMKNSCLRLFHIKTSQGLKDKVAAAGSGHILGCRWTV